MELVKCFVCEGTGKIQVERDDYLTVGGIETFEATCTHCLGGGKVVADNIPCSRCGEVHLLEVEDEEPLCIECVCAVIDETLDEMEVEQ